MNHSLSPTNTENNSSKENFMLWCNKFAKEYQYFQLNSLHTSEDMDSSLIADFSAIKLLTETPLTYKNE
jgi:hypothetical protein